MSEWKQQMLAPNYGHSAQISAVSASYVFSRPGLTTMVQVTNAPCDPPGDVKESEIPAHARAAIKTALHELLSSIPD